MTKLDYIRNEIEMIEQGLLLNADSITRQFPLSKKDLEEAVSKGDIEVALEKYASIYYLRDQIALYCRNKNWR